MQSYLFQKLISDIIINTHLHSSIIHVPPLYLHIEILPVSIDTVPTCATDVLYLSSFGETVPEMKCTT